jgi:hypothetical protein
MDYVEATKKIVHCIETARTLEHHKAIVRMIASVSKHSGGRDRTLAGALVFLEWYNKDVYQRNKEKNLVV